MSTAYDSYIGIANRLYPRAELKAMVRLTGGVSADVHRLDLKLADGTTTRVVLRAYGATYTSHVGRSAELEYRLLQALHRGGVPVPEPLLVDVSGSLLAHPFLVIAFVEGTSDIPTAQKDQYIDVMADTLTKIHALPTAGLPTLPVRIDPLPELLNYLPDGPEWEKLRVHLSSLADTTYLESPKLLHGDFWTENVLWQNSAVATVAAILDWEDAAFGDPLSDVACCRVELRYMFGKASMQRFTHAYERHRALDHKRLALWQVYVAAAAHQFMSEWGLAPALEAHMRTEALQSIREAGAELMGQTAL